MPASGIPDPCGPSLLAFQPAPTTERHQPAASALFSAGVASHFRPQPLQLGRSPQLPYLVSQGGRLQVCQFHTIPHITSGDGVLFSVFRLLSLWSTPGSTDLGHRRRSINTWATFRNSGPLQPKPSSLPTSPRNRASPTCCLGKATTTSTRRPRPQQDDHNLLALARRQQPAALARPHPAKLSSISFYLFLIYILLELFGTTPT